jgi:type II secretory pathway predicted ATPase ExeA
MHTPAGSPAVPSSLTYEPHFGLAEKPFSLAVNPKFLYKSPTHRVAFDRLLAGVRRREGLIVLTGEVGTGKTTVCRAVIEALDRRTFSAFVPDPFVTREDLLKAVLIDFGVVSTGDIKAGRLQGASRQDLSHLLYEFLHSIAPLDAFAVIVVDEAQNLSLPVLEEIRILSELETGERMLQVVLVGQPELRAHLMLPEMRQMNQRVSVRAELAPLDAEGVTSYIAHRLSIAAHDAARGVAFTPEALDAVWRASAGVPRLVNKICDRSLESACATGATAIDAAHVRTALTALELPAVAEKPSGYAVPVRVTSPAMHPGSHTSAGMAPVRVRAFPAIEMPAVITAAEADAGLDAFASEAPAPAAAATTPAPRVPARPPAPPPAAQPAARPAARPQPLPTLFSSHAPALGRTADAPAGWLSKLWRASIYVVALGGAVATSGVLDLRRAPWQGTLTPLPAQPPEPRPVFAVEPAALTRSPRRPAARIAKAPVNATPSRTASAGSPALRANAEIVVAAPAPETPGSSEHTTIQVVAVPEAHTTTGTEAEATLAAPADAPAQ